MYFPQIILTAFNPYVCNYVPNVSLLPQLPSDAKFCENVNSLSCAVQKFTQLIPSLKQESNIKLNLSYMKLNQKYSSISLPSTQEFINFYFTIANRYKVTYATNKIKNSWGQQDIIILLWCVNWVHYKNNTHPICFTTQDWIEVASLVPFRSQQDCMYKWLSMRKNQLQECPWSEEQKNQLTSIVQSNSTTNWGLVSKQLFRRLPENYRTPKQCKQCWSIILSLSFERANKFWSLEQDGILLDSYVKLGRKWKIIASIMKGRSQNAIKNRFNLLSQKFINLQQNNINKKQFVPIQQKTQEEIKETNNSD